MKFDYLKTMRDQAIFVAAFFSIFGLITTDMYYSTFGVKYQFLNLNATHMVYRGFTEIYFNPLFFGVFIIILVGVLTESGALHGQSASHRNRRSIFCVRGARHSVVCGRLSFYYYRRNKRYARYLRRYHKSTPDQNFL